MFQYVSSEDEIKDFHNCEDCLWNRGMRCSNHHNPCGQFNCWDIVHEAHYPADYLKKWEEKDA